MITYKTIYKALIFTFTISSLALGNPHPYLYQAAKEGRWHDFKSFILAHPDEVENCDDSVFRLVHAANRWDVFGETPLPSAPPLEEDEAIARHNPPPPSAPPMEPFEQRFYDDAELARQLQAEEFAVEQPAYDYVEEQPDTGNRQVCNFGVCHPVNLALATSVAIGACLVWIGHSL